ncbi:MAG: MerR family transcriptional regulator [Anaerolineaceae bacterium]|nr:MerR family transcriptional regulator [Anaerolineaceae bacterium]
METEMRYTVRQLAVIAGVSARTLHYYDEINLLKPERNPANGYRLYDRTAVLRLQQILFLRELGFSLEEIREVLDQPDFNLLAVLEQHRLSLQARGRKLADLIATVERTISFLKGAIEMDVHELFDGFSEEKQKQYKEEARRRYGDQKVDESYQRWDSYSDDQKLEIIQEGKAVYQDMVEVMPYGPSSQQAQEGIARWHQHIRHFYEPTVEILAGLGDLYNDDPQFNATFNRIHPGLAAFMRLAIQVYCQSLS